MIASCAFVDIHGACRHASGPCRVPSCWNLRHSRSIKQGTPYWIDSEREVSWNAVAQGCSNTLCSLFVLRTDLPHVPHERRRSDVEPFATHPLTDGTNLIPRNALLDAMEDNDDIEWPEDPLDRPHRAEPELPDSI